MKYSSIVPAVISRSESEVRSYAKSLSFSREFHLDVVDGNFVPNTSWPYEPEGAPEVVRDVLDRYTLEVDLMVEKPLVAAAEWIRAGADMLVFHMETVELADFTAFTKETSVSVGVSGHGATTMADLFPYIEVADYIQLMGIYEIGAQGQPLDEAVFEKIAAVKKRFPKKCITIDGSVNKDTIVRLKEAGANRFICGSAIVKQPDPELAHKALRTLINE